jgi:hypothetical protein
MNIMAPISQRPRADMGPYPGGQPSITDKYMSTGGRINNTPGWRTNGSIRISIETRTRDQNHINVNQVAWLFNKDFAKPKMLNLQQVNQWLADPQNEKSLKNKIINDDKKIRPYEVERANILKLFKMIGVAVNRDVDNRDDMAIERIARATTLTVRGVTWLLDYWSRNGKILKPYDSCYFILKKVWMNSDTRFQTLLTASKHNTGTPMAFNDGTPRWVWQFVPYHTSENSIDINELSFTDNEGPGFGAYWHVCNIHEYPDIGHPKMFKKRDEYSVSRDITYLHDNGAIKPIHVYLKFDTAKIL